MKIMFVGIRRMKEVSDGEESTCTTNFTDESIQVLNNRTNVHCSLKYGLIIKILDVKDAYVLFTETWQFVTVFKADLSDKEQEEFILFLKSKSTKIKW